jgi:hypothetical protein
LEDESEVKKAFPCVLQSVQSRKASGVGSGVVRDIFTIIQRIFKMTKNYTVSEEG